MSHAHWRLIDSIVDYCGQSVLMISLASPPPPQQAAPSPSIRSSRPIQSHAVSANKGFVQHQPHEKPKGKQVLDEVSR